MMLTTVEVLDGKISVTDSANSNKVSGGTVTITATAQDGSGVTGSLSVTVTDANV